MVIWSDPAKKDLKLIFEYISQDSKYYAHEVIDKIIGYTDTLIDYPRIGRVVPELQNESIRELFLYSYRIIYEIRENIEILAIIHGKQDLRNRIENDSP